MLALPLHCNALLKRPRRLRDESCGRSGGRAAPAFATASAPIAESDARIASVLRRMRAVTGSSAEIARLVLRSGVASTLCPAFSALIRSASSLTDGLCSASGAGAVIERPAFNWSRNVSQLRQVGFVRERCAKPSPVVA